MFTNFPQWDAARTKGFVFQYVWNTGSCVAFSEFTTYKCKIKALGKVENLMSYFPKLFYLEPSLFLPNPHSCLYILQYQTWGCQIPGVSCVGPWGDGPDLHLGLFFLSPCPKEPEIVTLPLLTSVTSCCYLCYYYLSARSCKMNGVRMLIMLIRPWEFPTSCTCFQRRGPPTPKFP